MKLERTRPDGCLSDFLLDHLINDELEEKQRLQASDHLAGCSPCAARLEAMNKNRDAFRENPPALELSARKESRRGMSWLLAPAGAVAALVAVVIWLAIPGDDSPGIRTKGKPSLGFFVKHGDSVRPGKHGDTVYPEDKLRFFYTWNRPGHLAILSLDGAGQISVYYPRGEKAAAIRPGEKVAIEESAVLDETLGKEVFLGYFCEQAIGIEDLKKAVARHSDPQAVPQGCLLDKFPVVKRKNQP